MPYQLVPVNYDPFALVKPTQQGTYAPVNPAQDYARAIQELKTYTGLADLQAAIAAAQRGEATQALGQGTAGLLGALSVIQPAARAPAAAAKALESAPIRNALGQAAEALNPLLGNVNRIENQLMPIRAYHGSPHDFDRFDLSKIGTGEGAQAYGHGLYFAETPEVAQTYRDMFERQAAAFRDKGLDITVPSGKMYEVNIHADPDTFLLWDKPLSEQPEKVRQAATKVFNDLNFAIPDRVEQLPTGRWVPMAGDTIIGRQDGWPDRGTANDVMRWTREEAEKNSLMSAGQLLQRTYGGQNIEEKSQRLAQEGVAGIKYLDQGSRGGSDKGTSNYVVFDDKMVEILRKYGLLGMLGGSAAMLPGQTSANPYPHPTDEYIEPPPKKP